MRNKTKEEIETLARDYHFESQKSLLNAEMCFARYQGFVKGYIQCQKDTNDNHYTKEDMEKAFKYGRTLEPFDCFEDFIISLKKQN
jgi:hypothetical protein